MFALGTKGWLSGAVLLGLSLALVACGGSTEEGNGGGGGQAGTGGTGGTAGSGGAAGQAGSGGSAGQAGTGGSAGQAGTGGSAGQAGTGGSAGSAGQSQSGDCDDNDPNLVCPDNGSTCTELVPGGFTVCALQVEEATACTGSGMDDCCETSECAEGACYPYPSFPSCGGAQPPEMNVCASDLCENDSDCQGSDQFCAPRGVNNNAVRYCMPKGCTTDADCNAKADGKCAPVRNPCCGSWTGLFCVYPDGCRTDGDCDNGQYCDVNWDEGTGECMDGGPMCPA